MKKLDIESIFKDLIIVELASVLAGPSVGMFFAELGARVIKIENKRTNGDVTRRWKLPSEDGKDPFSAYYHSVNYHKERYLLDLRDSKDFEQVLKWIDKCDILISNFKPGSEVKLGLDFEYLSKRNPGLIYGLISAYGKDNPKPGFDIVIQAETGWMFMTGSEGGTPVKIPVALMDVLVAHQLKEGILIALINRMKSNQGSLVHASLYDAGISSLKNQASNWLNAGFIPQRIGSRHPNISPYGDILEMKDGVFVVLAPGTQKHFIDLCECLEIPEIANDTRFISNKNRLINRDALFGILSKVSMKFSYNEFAKKCIEKKVPIASVRDLSQVFSDPMSRNLVQKELLGGGSSVYSVKEAIFNIWEK